MVKANPGHGIALVAAAAIAWSTAPLFVRLLPFDPFTILFWRGIFAACGISVFLIVAQGRSGLRDFARIGRGGWLFAILSTLGMVLFIPSLQMTSVANVAIILTTAPFAAAALAWLWLREVPRMRTVLASALAVVGVALAVGGASTVSDLKGVIVATVMMLAIAGMTVAARRYRETPLIAAAALSNVLGSAVCLPLARDLPNVSGGDMVVLAMFGILQVALGLTLFVLGSRHLPSAQTALIATLETPLMPFWIWLAFNEVPTSGQLIGGALVLAAVIADTVSDARSRENAPQPSKQ
jgi:drug/metabolite transporter (DMT)-like permease